MSGNTGAKDPEVRLPVLACWRAQLIPVRPGVSLSRLGARRRRQSLFARSFASPSRNALLLLLPESSLNSRPQTGNTLSAHNEGVAYEEGKKGSHDTIDSKDERSIANRLKAAEHNEKKEDQADEEDKMRPTEIAKSHGNVRRGLSRTLD